MGIRTGTGAFVPPPQLLWQKVVPSSRAGPGRSAAGGGGQGGEVVPLECGRPPPRPQPRWPPCPQGALPWAALPARGLCPPACGACGAVRDPGPPRRERR